MRFLCALLAVPHWAYGVVITGDAFNVFVFLEISSLSTYVLIAQGCHQDKRVHGIVQLPYYGNDWRDILCDRDWVPLYGDGHA